MITTIRLSQWAKNNGYTYQGAYEMYARGHLTGSRKLQSGSIVVDIDTKITKPQKTVIYARVSTPKQKDDLDRQAERLTNYCITNGYIVDTVVKEIASGLNDSRPKLINILKDDSITTLVVENKDRLTRFGFNYIKECLSKTSCEILVVNKSDDAETDLMQDFISVITSMAARVYGNRRGSTKTKKILEVINEQETCLPK